MSREFLKMTSKEYIKEVELLLVKFKLNKKQIKKLLVECEQDIKDAFENNFKPIDIALPMSANLI